MHVGLIAGRSSPRHLRGATSAWRLHHAHQHVDANSGSQLGALGAGCGARGAPTVSQAAASAAASGEAVPNRSAAACAVARRSS